MAFVFKSNWIFLRKEQVQNKNVLLILNLLSAQQIDTILDLSAVLGELKIQFPLGKIRQNNQRQFGIEKRQFGP